MRAELLLPCLLAACAQDQGTLARLQEAYGDETVAAMSPPLASSALLAAVAVDLCLTRDSGAWAEADGGEIPPMDPELLAVLGEPLVGSVTAGPELNATITGLRLLGDTGRVVEIAAVDGEPYLVSGLVLDGDSGVIGTFDFEVVADCTSSWSRLLGTLEWTDDTGMSHEVRFPSDSSGDAGTDWPGAAIWLPGAGSVTWSGRIHAEERTFVSDDAATIQLDGDIATWRGTVNGVEWSAEIEAELSLDGD